jgi:hypothetical protein
MSKEKDQKAKFATATRLQVLVKKQVLNRTPDNVAIHEIVKFLPDPPKDNTASINAVKSNASKKINQAIKDASEAITTCREKAEKDIDYVGQKLTDQHRVAKKAFDVYQKKVLAVVKGTMYEKKIQSIK